MCGIYSHVLYPHLWHTRLSWSWGFSFVVYQIPEFGTCKLKSSLVEGEWGSFSDLEQVSFEALLTRFVKSLAVSVSAYIAPNDAAGLKARHS